MSAIMSAVLCPTASGIWMGRKTVQWRIVSSASRRGKYLVDCLELREKLDVIELLGKKIIARNKFLERVLDFLTEDG